MFILSNRESLIMISCSNFLGWELLVDVFARFCPITKAEWWPYILLSISLLNCISIMDIEEYEESDYTFSLSEISILDIPYSFKFWTFFWSCEGFDDNCSQNFLDFTERAKSERKSPPRWNKKSRKEDRGSPLRSRAKGEMSESPLTNN